MSEKCIKCGYESDSNTKKSGLSFCSVCTVFAPNNPEELDKYAEEKAKKGELEVFRKYADLRGHPQKKAMLQKAARGSPMSRPAFGYKFEQGKLIPAENFREVEEIFEDFLNQNSLDYTFVYPVSDCLRLYIPDLNPLAFCYFNLNVLFCSTSFFIKSSIKSSSISEIEKLSSLF